MRRREEVWRAEARKREDRAREREAELENKWQAQFNQAKAEPVRNRIDPRTLPKLAEDSSLDSFIELFESQLTAGGIPEVEWKFQLMGQLDECHKLRVSSIIADVNSTYEEVVQALRQASGETRLSAERRYHAVEPDCTQFKDAATGLRVIKQWLKRLGEGLQKKGFIDVLARARLTSWFSESLKIFTEDRTINSDAELLAAVADWKSRTHDELSLPQGLGEV